VEKVTVRGKSFGLVVAEFLIQEEIPIESDDRVIDPQTLC
jgi:hypothetical protein